MVINSKIYKTWTLIDVAILADRNVTQKEAQKEVQYKIHNL
jgi:hypothetical protein